MPSKMAPNAQVKANHSRNPARLWRCTSRTASCMVPEERTNTTVATPTVLGSTVSPNGGQTGVAARNVK